jgi:hypothetical protein
MYSLSITILLAQTYCHLWNVQSVYYNTTCLDILLSLKCTGCLLQYYLLRHIAIFEMYSLSITILLAQTYCYLWNVQSVYYNTTCSDILLSLKCTVCLLQYSLLRHIAIFEMYSLSITLLLAPVHFKDSNMSKQVVL